MYQKFGISEKIEKLSTKVEKDVENIFNKIDEVCTVNSLKVLQAFQNNKILSEGTFLLKLKSLR